MLVNIYGDIFGGTSDGELLQSIVKRMFQKSMKLQLLLLKLPLLYWFYPIKNYRGLSPNYRGQRWAFVHFIGGAANYPIIYP